MMILLWRKLTYNTSHARISQQRWIGLCKRNGSKQGCSQFHPIQFAQKRSSLWATTEAYFTLQIFRTVTAQTHNKPADGRSGLLSCSIFWNFLIKTKRWDNFAPSVKTEWAIGQEKLNGKMSILSVKTSWFLSLCPTVFDIWHTHATYGFTFLILKVLRVFYIFCLLLFIMSS